MLGGLEEKPKEGYVQEGVAKGLVSVPCPPLGGEYYPPCPPRAETPAVCNSDFNMFTHISAYLSLAIATNSWLTDHLIIRLPSTTRSPHSICYPPPKCSWLAQPPRSWPQELLGSEIWHLLPGHHQGCRQGPLADLVICFLGGTLSSASSVLDGSSSPHSVVICTF